MKISKEAKRIYLLEIILCVSIIVIWAVSYVSEDTRVDIQMYIALFYITSWFLTIIFIEILLVVLKGKIFKKPKKAKVFEYAFLLGLFWATALLTDAYSRPHDVGSDFLKFLDNFGIAIAVYGFATACGWFHYIERIDD
jgi:hypothetical protein